MRDVIMLFYRITATKEPEVDWPTNQFHVGREGRRCGSLHWPNSRPNSALYTNRSCVFGVQTWHHDRSFPTLGVVEVARLSDNRSLEVRKFQHYQSHSTYLHRSNNRREKIIILSITDPPDKTVTSHIILLRSSDGTTDSTSLITIIIRNNLTIQTLRPITCTRLSQKHIRIIAIRRSRALTAIAEICYTATILCHKSTATAIHITQCP